MEKGHGRIEIRSIQTSTGVARRDLFPYAEQCFRLERTRIDLVKDKTVSEVVFGVTSCLPEEADDTRLMQIVRGHWGIENGIHHIRDMLFDEDRCRVRTGNGPRMMATLRNIAISLIHLSGSTEVTRNARRYALKPELTLELLGV